MRIIDYLILASIVGCMFIGYSGYRLIAVLLLILIAIVASWRFWDRRREQEMRRTGGSGELDPDQDHASVSQDDDSSGDVGDDN